jgi:hypothetical protein
VSKVLELNSRFVHASMKGLTFLNLFEFLLEFSNKKSSSNVQSNGIDNKEDPFDSPPFLKHQFTSKWGSNININIARWATDATETCLILNHIFVKTRWKFIRKRNFTFDECNHACSTGA